MNKNIMRFLHVCSGLALLIACYFFWFNSAFPATRPETGIVFSEWIWIVQLGLPVLLVVLILKWRGMSMRWLWVLAGIYVLWYIPLVMRQATFDVDRQDWFWLLSIPFVIIIIQGLVSGRLWSHTVLDFPMITLIVLCVISTQIAPFEDRGIKMIMRPLFGVLLAIYLGELGRYDFDLMLKIILVFCLFMGIMALSATQWTEKSADFRFIIDRLNFLPSGAPFFVRNSINPNEIGGALAWLIPLTAGLVFYRPWGWVWRGLSIGGTLMLCAALIMGQSRSAILGVLIALVLVALIVIPGRWRVMALGSVGGLLLIQLIITFNLFSGESGITARDEAATSQRMAYWQAGLQMLQDYPLTGVGMNNYRALVFDGQPYDSDVFGLVPHAHNEFLQIATDLGIPGLMTFLGLYFAAAYLVWKCWRLGGGGVAIAAFAGLLAHAIYGLTDAIPVWDRLGFIFWGMLGVIVAQYSVLKSAISNTSKGLCIED